jgi:hypothetical protein
MLISERKRCSTPLRVASLRAEPDARRASVSSPTATTTAVAWPAAIEVPS